MSTCGVPTACRGRLCLRAALSLPHGAGVLGGEPGRRVSTTSGPSAREKEGRKDQGGADIKSRGQGGLPEEVTFDRDGGGWRGGPEGGAGVLEPSEGGRGGDGAQPAGPRGRSEALVVLCTRWEPWEV